MEHTKPYWSSEEVSERISEVEELLEYQDALEQERARLSGQVLWVIQKMDEVVEEMDAAKLEPLVVEHFRLKKALHTCGTAQHKTEIELDAAVAMASLVMNDNDYRFLLRHPKAEKIVDSLPGFPTGALFQITHYFDLESIVAHADSYWTSAGIKYFFEGDHSNGALMVTLVGLPKYLLDWLLTEFSPEDSIVGEFQKCENPAFIAAYIEANRVPPVKNEGAEIEH